MNEKAASAKLYQNEHACIQRHFGDSVAEMGKYGERVPVILLRIARVFEIFLGKNEVKNTFLQVQCYLRCHHKIYEYTSSA